MHVTSLLLLPFLAPLAATYVISSPDHALLQPPSPLVERCSPSTVNACNDDNVGEGRQVDAMTMKRGKDRTTRDFPNKIILIRHGEKRRKGKPGLSRAGKQRAQCLRRVLGRHSKHNIGLVIAQDYNRVTRARERPFKTVQPVARDLGLKVDTSCARDEPACVVKLVESFVEHNREQNVLIAWKHSFLAPLAQALGSTSDAPYPDDRYDIMWVLHQKRIVEKKSEKCKGLDEGRRRLHDSDLEVEGADASGEVDHDSDDENSDDDDQEEEKDGDDDDDDKDSDDEGDGYEHDVDFATWDRHHVAAAAAANEQIALIGQRQTSLDELD